MNDDKLSLNGCGGITRRASKEELLQERVKDLESHLKLYLDILATKKGTDAEYINWLNKAEELLK